MKPEQRHSVPGLSILPDNDYDAQKLSDLIGDIYDTVLDQALWEDIVERAAQFVGGVGAALFSKNAAYQEGSVQYDFGIDPHYKRLYFEKYIMINAFGDQYRRYRQQVGMLFPMPRGK